MPSVERELRDAPVSYHRAGANGRPGGGSRRFPVRVVAATAALAILIGAAILTIPELIAGDSLGKTSGGTTLFGGAKQSPDESQDSEPRDGSQRQDGSPQPEQGQPQSDQQDSTTPEQQRQQQNKTPPSDPKKAPTTPVAPSQSKSQPQQRQPQPAPVKP